MNLEIGRVIKSLRKKQKSNLRRDCFFVCDQNQIISLTFAALPTRSRT